MKVTLIIAMLLCAHLVFAQTNYVPVADKTDFIRQYQTACAQIKSMQCQFEQVKEITLMKNTLKSSGEMFFRNDSKFKIAYQKPNVYIFALDGDKIFMKDGDRAATSANTKSNKLFQQISKITMNMIDGKIFDAQEFDIEIFENDTQYMIQAIPKSKELKQYYNEIDLFGNKKVFLPESIVMKEVSGDMSTMTLKNTQTNITLRDEVFQIR